MTGAMFTRFSSPFSGTVRQVISVVGTCWMGVAPRKERMEAVRNILGIPADVEPFNLIAVGHPAEERSRPERWDETIVHKNNW